ncbi:hypothetical protein BVG79_01089 [Ketogulonicigenium robustum]|uniref:Uncharacterized protein n=1 Tax=Ketogulonicigenium robustum TaxID=92947 RepID=A0A1W6NYW2_9RHOB|nr:hypothetical protein [Ketogulonicigenium robustum]ARO14435.1 hypothetical protein BVG79_01089 [Ketogulonicigenium robustum]
MADFRNALAMAESGGDYGVTNTLGYMGRYQFGDDRLTDFQRATGQQFTREQFLGSPDLQEAAYAWHIADIDRQLAPLVGAVVGGQTMDRDALRGMAHLGGVGGARRYVESGGAYNPSDAYGTALSDYAGRFGGQGTQEAPAATVNALATTPAPQEPQQNALALPPRWQPNYLDPQAFQLDLSQFVRRT